MFVKHFCTEAAKGIITDSNPKNSVNDSVAASMAKVLGMIDLISKILVNFLFNVFFFFSDICNLSPDPGPCPGSVHKYYYDPQISQCRAFYYSGCDGNANRFSSVAECQSICIYHEEPTASVNDTSSNVG